MDAAYLKKNVMEALTEALTAMAVKIPDDNIEFVGKYLLKYVERKKSEKEAKENLESVESNLVQFLASQEAKTKVVEQKEQEQNQFLTKYKRFLDSLQFDFTTKQDAMDAAVNFIENSLDIPAAYIAVKKTVGESEVLNYLAAGPSQKTVKGKKLLKPAADEGDEAPARQGISFEAFKLPEVPEEEEPAEETEDGAPAVAKPPPKAQPLIVDNAMRERRCKFFGIPRLGSYAAIPCSYQTVEHEEGCVMGTAEEGSEVPADYVFQRKEVQFLIGVDTVGKYRSFKAAEIERLVEMGNELVKLFGVLDNTIGQKQKEFLKSEAFKQLNAGVQGDFAAKMAEGEAAALAAAAASFAAQQAENAAAAGPDAEVNEGQQKATELIKTLGEAQAVLAVWTTGLAAPAITNGIVALAGYVLPPPAAVLNLFYAIGCLLEYTPSDLQNVCGDPDWAAIRKNCLESLPAKIANYDGTNSHKRKGAYKENTLPYAKSFAETAAILDAAAYPANMSLCSVALLPWFQKAMAARDAAIAFNLVVMNNKLE